MNALWVLLFAALVVIAVLSTFKLMARASKSYEKARDKRAESGPAIPCSTCGSTLRFAGLQEIQMTTDPSALGGDPNTNALPVEVYRCPTCRKVEVFLPPSAS